MGKLNCALRSIARVYGIVKVCARLLNVTIFKRQGTLQGTWQGVQDWLRARVKDQEKLRKTKFDTRQIHQSWCFIENIATAGVRTPPLKKGLEIRGEEGRGGGGLI